MYEPQYFAPKSIGEATSLLAEYGEKAKVIAGSTDLVAQMKERKVLPDYIINIGGITDLNYIKEEADGLRVGALTAIDSIEKSSVVRSKFSILADAAGLLGTPVIRRQATIGGNLCNAAPSADTAPALIVLGARAKIVGAGEEKVVAIEDFFSGPGQTILKQGQILAEIQIPDLPPHSGASYEKHCRRMGADLAVVGVAASVMMEGDILKDVKIALGAVAPTPIRAKKAEEILRGNKLDDKLLEEAGKTASGESSPIDDTRGSADYRRKLVTVLTKRAVKQAIEHVQ